MIPQSILQIILDLHYYDLGLGLALSLLYNIIMIDYVTFTECDLLL